MSGHAESSFGSGLAERMGHYSAELLMAAIGATILLNFQELDPSVGLLAAVGLVALVLTSWLLMRRHDRRLCEACMAALPLNPAEVATRQRRRFWMAHTGTQPRFFVPYLVVLVGSNFATSTIGRVGWALVQSSMIYLVLSSATHRRLQPWCPWCRGGGGGEDVDVTPPALPRDDRELV